MRKYTPRRQNKRWLDGDCPDGVLAIYDDPRYGDRYTVFYREIFEAGGRQYLCYRSMGENPFHPQGIGMRGEMLCHQVANCRYYNSKRAAKWSSLPELVKDCVRRDLRA